MVAMTSTMNQMLTSDFASVFTPFMSSKVGTVPATTVKPGSLSPTRSTVDMQRSGSAGDFQRITSLFNQGSDKCTMSPGCTCEMCEANLRVMDIHVDCNGNRCQSPRAGSTVTSPRLMQASPRIQPTTSSDSDESSRGSSTQTISEMPSPPAGCNSSDGEWVWMTAEDWSLLEEFTDASKMATAMLKEQRDALETKEERSSQGGFETHSPFSGEEVLLKELQQMRLQLAASQEEKSRLEQHNNELLKNCHFLHSQNMELKQKKAGRPRLGVGSSIFPRRSPLSTSDTTPAPSAEQ